jgi:ubiquinone/menaquinone biosynthesis C-methylase UbiE
MEHLQLQPKSFDVIYSSLAFHYVKNLTGLLSQAYRSMVPGGAVVFSIEHPIFTAPSRPNWSQDATGRKAWPIDGYLDEGPRSTDWLAKGVIKQHRTLATYINTLIGIGFGITHVEEWGPTPAQIAQQPDWADERQRPPFLMVAAIRKEP